MQGYENRLIADIHDVDPNGICRASSLMKYLQDAAQGQLNSGGLSYEAMRSRQRAFILSQMKMEFTSEVRAYEPLTTFSYPCESRGYSFLRCYQMVRDGEIIGRAVSVWALIDTEDRSLVRVENFDLPFAFGSPLDLSLSRIRMPSLLKEVGTYTVNYADLDQNKHMNNTRYPDIYSNFLPLDGKRISEISIAYKHEARFGEKLRVYSATVDGHRYFRTLLPDGTVNSEAEITLCDI